MFANAAQDHEQAEEAVMASPVISGVPNFCFEFYFDLKVIHMKLCISEYLLFVHEAIWVLKSEIFGQKSTLSKKNTG